MTPVVYVVAVTSFPAMVTSYFIKGRLHAVGFDGQATKEKHTIQALVQALSGGRLTNRLEISTG